MSNIQPPTWPKAGDKLKPSTTGKILFWLFLLAFIAAYSLLFATAGPDVTKGLTSLVFLGLISLLLYFLPTLVAISRKHRNRGAIITLNFVAGWTLIGWVVAIVWANTKDVEGNT